MNQDRTYHGSSIAVSSIELRRAAHERKRAAVPSQLRSGYRLRSDAALGGPGRRPAATHELKLTPLRERFDVALRLVERVFSPGPALPGPAASANAMAPVLRASAQRQPRHEPQAATVYPLHRLPGSVTTY